MTSMALNAVELFFGRKQDFLVLKYVKFNDKLSETMYMYKLNQTENF